VQSAKLSQELHYMAHKDFIPQTGENAVFHSVLNRTGATRYLISEVLPLFGEYRLVLWWPEEISRDGEGDGRDTLYLRGADATGRLARNRIVIFVLQILYLLRHRDSLNSVTVNSISNLGAMFGCLFLRACTKVTIIVHERPIGKWRISIAALHRIKSARILTVSPFNKAELQSAGITASWAYPTAFDTALAQDLPRPELRNKGHGDAVPDIVIVSHPDKSKGFAFLCALLSDLDKTLTVHLYLSRSPATDLRIPHNVVVRVGQALTRDDYRARLTVITSDPFEIKETFSYITAESLAAGTPVLCFPSGGISEQLIHGVNSYFASDYSVAAFKTDIEWLFSNPTRLNALQAGTVAINKLKARYSG
jgi:glycosyltransferase involved in cell wall biosynthesis